MVENNELQTTIGNEEAVTLKPAKVKILDAKIEIVGEKKAKKVVCEVKHPDKLEPIQISSVKCEMKGKLETSGIWFNTDSKGLIKKGSALALFLNSVGVKNIAELKDKEVETALGEKGYLAFKAY